VAVASAGKMFAEGPSFSPTISEAKKGYRQLVASLHAAQFFVGANLDALLESLGIIIAEKKSWPLVLSIESCLTVFLLVSNSGTEAPVLGANTAWTTFLASLSRSLFPSDQTGTPAVAVNAAHKDLLFLLFHFLSVDEREAVLAEGSQVLFQAVDRLAVSKEPCTSSQLANIAFLIRFLSCTSLRLFFLLKPITLPFSSFFLTN